MNLDNPTTFRDAVRANGRRTSDIGAVPSVIRASFDPTSSSQVELMTLPKGAIPLAVYSFGGATGGTDPTVDIGTSGDDDGFANELDADDVSFVGSGALTGSALSADTKVYGKVGSSAATGGTVTVAMTYIMNVPKTV